MATTCPVCGERFSLRQALCEDWQDPERSHGCPHCGTFLVRAPGPDRLGIRVAVLVVLVGMPCCQLLGHGYRSGDETVTLFAAIGTVGWFALMFVDVWSKSNRLVPSGHRRESGVSAGAD